MLGPRQTNLLLIKTVHPGHCGVKQQLNEGTIMIKKHVGSGDSRQPASNRWRSLTRSLLTALPLGLLVAATSPVQAQDSVEWTHLGGNAAHTRYTPATNITPDNFSELRGCASPIAANWEDFKEGGINFWLGIKVLF